MSAEDPFQGTTYRALVEADDAVQMARFLGVADGIGYEPASALEQIARAVAALENARDLLIADIESFPEVLRDPTHLEIGSQDA